MKTLIEQWEAMSERERDAWIAENVMGIVKRKCNRIGGCLKELNPTYTCKCDSDRYAPEPYNSDISAAMEAEEKIMQMGKLAMTQFENNLELIILERNGTCRRFDLIHASAADRCKAMYLTLMQKEREEG